MSETSAWIKAVLRGDQPDISISDEQSFFENVWKSSRDNGTTSLIHHHLINTPLWKKLPETFCDQVLSFVKNEIAMELLLQHELKTLLDTLASHNINGLLVKGTPLAYCLYPQPHLRTRCDTDLMFPNKDVAGEALDVLQKNGYIKLNAISGKYISHQVTCIKSGRNNISGQLDIHWRFNNHHYLASRLSYSELEEHSLVIPALFPLARAPCLEHALLLAFLHRVAHIPDGISNRLIWLYDIHLLSAKLSNEQWNRITDLALEKSICNVCLDGLNESKQAFASNIPEQVLAKLESGKTRDMMVFTHDMSRLKMQLLNFRALPGVKQRAGLLIEFLFPDPVYMKNKYNLKYGILLPAFYLIRLFGGLARVTFGR